ncbi:unnamed protein product [Zymoseptoria tritici ST99CH_3D1]|nr:unnamed protein product [Zymoseptoria tritici ST99CH_3D1]
MAPRQMEPIHYYYGNELGITAAVHPANALACPVRPYLKGEHYACKGPIGPYRKARIMQLLEDLHFHKSLISDTALNSVAPIARICSLIVKAGFCSKHKAETCKTVSETQFDQIYTKALECAIFQHPDTGKGDLDFEGVTQILQASNARTPSRCEAKHAREEKGNDLVQPSAPKKRCLDGGGLHKSCVLSSNESVGEGIVWPPSDEPLWANLPSDDSLWPNLPWPLVTDALGQPSLDTNKASSLQGDALEGNTIHQANEAALGVGVQSGVWLFLKGAKLSSQARVGVVLMLPERGRRVVNPERLSALQTMAIVDCQRRAMRWTIVVARPHDYVSHAVHAVPECTAPMPECIGTAIQ